MKRRENECYYDYQARRLLEQHRLAILAKGLPHWISSAIVYNRETKQTEKIAIQGTHIRPDKHRKNISKANKKAYKKARRAYKFTMQRKIAEEALRGSSGSNVNALMVSP